MRKVSIELPALVELNCPICEAEYSLGSGRLSGLERVFCPVCGAQASVYDSLHGEVRRRIYHAIRDALEHSIYEQQLMDRLDYFEDKANLE